MSSIDQVFIPCIVMYMEEEKKGRGGDKYTHTLDPFYAEDYLTISYV